MNFIKSLLSEEGTASSTRVVKLIISLLFCADWVFTRLYDRVAYTPSTELVFFVGSVLGISAISKYIENVNSRNETNYNNNNAEFEEEG